MSDLSKQVQLQKQINDLLTARQKLLDANSRQLSGQAKLAKELHNAMSGKNLDGLEARLGKIRSGMTSVADSASKAAENTRDIGRAASDAEKDIDKFNKRAVKMASALGAINGLRTGFALVTNVVKGATRVLGTFASVIGKIGLGILSIPFKIFSGLVKMSQDLGSPALRQALEEVRKTFGDLAFGSGAALKDSIKGVRSEFNSLTGSGFRGAASFGRIFGYGREGMANYLKENNELAIALGGSFASLTSKLKGKYAVLSVFRKGLGLTAEQQALMIKRATEAGGTVLGAQNEIAKLADGVGRQFGFTGKEIGTVMGGMYEDIKTFGGFTNKQLAAQATQAKRLGLELKDLQGISSAFSDFDQAAESVAFFGRAFGVSMNAMSLFQEEDPVKQIQSVQKAFQAQGLEFSKMNMQQKDAIMQRLNMTDKAAASIFSEKGYAMDYEDVKKASEKTAKKQISQASILLKISKNITRLVKDGKHNFTGFFDALGQGFTKGVRRTTEFRTLMYNLNQSLRQTDYAGRTLGRNFVKHFPGVKSLLGALADLFDPKKFIPALREINKHFMTFFNTLKHNRDAGAALEALGTNLKGTLNSFFGGKGQIVEVITNSVDGLATIFGNLKLVMMTKAAESAAAGLRAFTKVLKGALSGDKSLSAAGAMAGTEFGKRFGTQFSKLFNQVRFDLIPAIKNAAPVIFDAAMLMMDMFRDFLQKKEVYSKIINGMAEMFKLVLKAKMMIFGKILGGVTSDPLAAAALFTMLFGPGIVGALVPIILAKMTAAMAAAKAAGGFRMALGQVISGGLMGVTGKLGPATGPIAAKAASLGRNIVGALKFGITKFGPAAIALSLGKGIYDAATLKGKQITGGDRVAAAVRGTGAMLISIFTLGMADGKKVIDDAFGKQVIGPIAKNLQIMEKSSSPAMKAMVKHARAISKEASAYTEYAAAVDKAQNAASSLSKFIRDEDLKSFINFDQKEKENLEKIQSLEKKFGKGAEGGEFGGVRSSLAKMRRNLKFQTVYGKAGVHHTLRNTSREGGIFSHSAQDTFGALNDPKTQKKLNEIAHGGGPHAASAQFLLGAFMDGEIVNNGNYKKDMEAGVMSVIDQLQSMQETLTLKGRAEVAKRTSGKGMMESVFNEAGGKTEGKAAGDAYIRYLKNSLDNMIQSGAKEEVIKAHRGKIEKAQSTLKELITDQAEMMITGKMLDDEMMGIANKAGFFDDFKTSGGAQHFNVDMLDEATRVKLHDQATARLTQALQSGDMSKLSGDAVSAAVMTSLKDANMGGILDKANTDKLQNLEAAASTVQRIKALEGIPEQLTTLQEKLSKVKSEDVKDAAVKLVETAMSISGAINEAGKGKLDKATATTVHDSFILQFQQVRSIQDGIMSVVGTKSIGPKTRKARITRFKDGVTEINAAFIKISELKFDAKKALPVMSMLALLPQVTQGIISAVPENLENKITQAKKAVDAVNEMITNVQKVGGTKVESIVELVDVLNKGGELVVRSGTDVKVACHVQMNVDVTELANSIVLQPIDMAGQSGGDNFQLSSGGPHPLAR